MGISILHDKEDDTAALYCNTTDIVFGPLIWGNEEAGLDAYEMAEAFMSQMVKEEQIDLRRHTPAGVVDLYNRFIEEHGKDAAYLRKLAGVD